MRILQEIEDLIQTTTQDVSFQEALRLYYELESNPIFESAIYARKDAIIKAYNNKDASLLIQELKAVVVAVGAPAQVQQAEPAFGSQEPALEPTIRAEHAIQAQEVTTTIEQKKQPRRSFIQQLVARFSLVREIPQDQLQEAVSKTVLDAPDPHVAAQVLHDQNAPITARSLESASTMSSFSVLFSGNGDASIL
mgnify:FL=1